MLRKSTINKHNKAYYNLIIMSCFHLLVSCRNLFDHKDSLDALSKIFNCSLVFPCMNMGTVGGPLLMLSAKCMGLPQRRRRREHGQRNRKHPVYTFREIILNYLISCLMCLDRLNLINYNYLNS